MRSHFLLPLLVIVVAAVLAVGKSAAASDLPDAAAEQLEGCPLLPPALVDRIFDGLSENTSRVRKYADVTQYSCRLANAEATPSWQVTLFVSCHRRARTDGLLRDHQRVYREHLELSRKGKGTRPRRLQGIGSHAYIWVDKRVRRLSLTQLNFVSARASGTIGGYELVSDGGFSYRPMPEGLVIELGRAAARFRCG